MLTHRWFLMSNTMFTAIPRTTAAQAYRAYLGVGLPGFQFIQDPVSYSTKTHHSSNDNWDHAVADDMRQAATIIASFAWHCAQRDEKLPRKAPPPRRQRRGR